MVKLPNCNNAKKGRISNGVRYLTFLLTLAIVFTVSGACFGSEAALQRAWTYYLKGDYYKAVELCRKISGQEMLGEEGRYIMGLSFLKLGDFQQTRKNFQFLLKNYPDGRKKEETLLGLADSYFLEGELGKAEEYYIRLLKGFPGTDYASIAYLGLGKCQRKQGKWQEAESSFHKVTRDFPFSLEAEAAKDCLKKRVSYFSVQAGAFSKKENAQKLTELLRNKGYDAYIEKCYDRDRLIYRVRVGKFDTEGGAQEEAARLKKQGYTVRICN